MLVGFTVSAVSPPIIVFLMVDFAEAKVRCEIEALITLSVNDDGPEVGVSASYRDRAPRWGTGLQRGWKWKETH